MHGSHVTRGHVSNARGRKIDKVLKPFNAYYASVSGPFSGNDPRVWIESPNMGSPFDGQRERAMTAALEAAGLYPLVKPAKSAK